MRTDTVACVAQIAIAGVFTECKVTLRQPLADIRPRYAQKRAVVGHIIAPPLRWHCTQTCQPATAAQRQQQCLNLIIGMLRNCYRFNSN